jgi:hypothetical protein
MYYFKMEAAGIEPASNKDPVKASTSLVCFNTSCREKTNKTFCKRPFQRFIPERQKANQSGHILLYDALIPPQEREIRTATFFYAARAKSFAVLCFEHFYEVLGSTCNFNPIKTVEPISPPFHEGMAGPTRLELATSGVTGQRSHQLNYDPIP